MIAQDFARVGVLGAVSRGARGGTPRKKRALSRRARGSPSQEESQEESLQPGSARESLARKSSARGYPSQEESLKHSAPSSGAEPGARASRPAVERRRGRGGPRIVVRWTLRLRRRRETTRESPSLQALGLEHRLARFLSFWPALTWNRRLNRVFTFAERPRRPPARQWGQQRVRLSPRRSEQRRSRR